MSFLVILLDDSKYHQLWSEDGMQKQIFREGENNSRHRGNAPGHNQLGKCKGSSSYHMGTWDDYGSTGLAKKLFERR